MIGGFGDIPHECPVTEWTECIPFLGSLMSWSLYHTRCRRHASSKGIQVTAVSVSVSTASLARRPIPRAASGNTLPPGLSMWATEVDCASFIAVPRGKDGSETAAACCWSKALPAFGLETGFLVSCAGSPVPRAPTTRLILLRGNSMILCMPRPASQLRIPQVVSQRARGRPTSARPRPSTPLPADKYLYPGADLGHGIVDANLTRLQVLIIIPLEALRADSLHLSA